MLSQTAALIFLPFVAPIAFWAAWSDLKFMKIPNKSVLALMGVYFFIGLILVMMAQMSLQTWLWGWGLVAIVMAIAFVVSSLNMVGAGDAKFAAAMAPFFMGAPLGALIGLFCASLLAAFFSHRLMRAVPAVRSATTDWASWTNRQFPMGLGLSGALTVYLVVLAVNG